ncbi:hypothetical protein BH24ACT15_BH24ACT15_27630 [soil metagenome]
MEEWPLAVLPWVLIARRVHVAWLYHGTLVLAGLGWLLMWTSATAPSAFIGLALAGLGASGHFPLGAVLLMNASAGQPDRALAIMAIGLGAASGVGPLALGVLAMPPTSAPHPFLSRPS